ncbi:trmB, partial [Mucuna pruriens]
IFLQCPNPDFNKPEHRWRMLQRYLIEAVVDLLAPNGKIFLQSDVEAVAIRMKEQFLRYGKGKLDLEHGQSEWLEENPFGVRSDWEKHVLERGAPMYRMMFSKSSDAREKMQLRERNAKTNVFR